MGKKNHEDVKKAIASLPAVGLNESAEGFETIKTFLARFGYLACPFTGPTEQGRRRGLILV